MKKDYVHIEKGKEIRFISGFYEVEEEKILKFGKGEVLVIIGHAVVDTSCCGMGGCRYALVPGYLMRWKYRKDEKGRDVSEIELLSQEEKKEIEKILRSREVIQQVVFW